METALVAPLLGPLAPPPSLALLPCRSAARRVLVVEDDLELEAPVRAALREIDPDLQIDWFTEGSSVYAEICRGCELVIADVRLPGETSGIRLWSLCRLFLPELPFLLMSACGGPATEGVDPRRLPSFLPKPFTTSELKLHVEALLVARAGRTRRIRNGPGARRGRRWLS